MGSLELTKEVLSAVYFIRESLQYQHDDIKHHLNKLTSAFTEIIGNRTSVGPESSTSSFSSNGSEELVIQEQLYYTSCMRDAVQQHTVKLAQSLLFTETNIPDLIFEKGITAEYESERLRKLQTTEDQISGLISLMLKRDKACLDVFLEIIKPHCEDIVNDIQSTYQCFVEDSDHSDRVSCSVCEIKSSCEIKWVYNHLFEKKLISSDLQRKIAFVSDLISTNDLWDELLREVQPHPPIWVISVLIEAVQKYKSSNGTLLLLLKRFLRKGRQLQCKCRAGRQKTDFQDKSIILADKSCSRMLQAVKKVTTEPIISDDKYNGQKLEPLKIIDDQNKENTNTNLKQSLSKRTDETNPNIEQITNDYETIWPVYQNRSLGREENLTGKEPILQGGDDQLSPELTRKGSGSNETQVKRAKGEHKDGKKFHRKHYDLKKFKERAIKYQISEQLDVKEGAGT